MNPNKTTVTKGEISIHTENIFPIIKKWLYSEKEIFIRELISNAFDAINKLKQIAVKEKLSTIDKGKIEINLDDKAKTITIRDNGLGMDSHEIQKYINQIAFSGAEDFINKYKDKDKDKEIIGYFGLGFYSSFMVADKVEINTLSFKKQAEACNWTCDGTTTFEISKSDKKEIGTDVILHLNKENHEFTNENKIMDLVKKYANFLPVEIQVNGKPANDQAPLWLKQPQDLKKEDYQDFYKKLFPFQTEPLFWIHLNIDYPFRLQGILFFPKIMHELDSHKGRVKLFCQQVFVTDNAQEIIPEFLTLLQGAIDCPDFPLNVSRSMLQNDPYVQKISSHIVKKVSDKLIELFKKDKDSFEKYWADIHPFVKYGMMTSDNFYEKVKDIIIFKSSNNYYTTISEYINRLKDKKDKKVVYSTDKEGQATYIKLLNQENIEVIFLDAVIDTHFIQFIESKNTDIKFVSVDTQAVDHLIDTENESKIIDPKDNKTQNDKIEKIFKNVINNEAIKIQAKNLKSKEIPAMIIQEEHTKRIKEIGRLMPNQNMGNLFNEKTLIINSQNKIIQNILSLSNNSLTPKKADLLCQQVYDLALLSYENLSGEKMKAFIERSTNLLEQIKL